MTYLENLATDQAKTAIAEFTYCGTMYKVPLKTLGWKFGQPQAVVSAYLEKFSKFPPLKRHNSESVISYSARISALVGVFQSLHYHQDLSSASLLGQAAEKLPPNLKEAWPLHTMKNNWDRLTLLEFYDWLKNKAEAHERMKLSSEKRITEESNPPANVTGTKTGTKILAPTVSSQTPSMGDEAEDRPVVVLLVKKNTLYGVVRCSAKTRLHIGRNWLQTTNCVFHA